MLLGAARSPFLGGVQLCRSSESRLEDSSACGGSKPKVPKNGDGCHCTVVFLEGFLGVHRGAEVLGVCGCFLCFPRFIESFLEACLYSYVFADSTLLYT